jgi:hypothetical protein
VKRLFFLLMIAALASPAFGEQGKRSLTDVEVKAIKQAVEDEIYDYGQQGGFYQLGENLGASEHWIGQLPIYVNPVYDTHENIGQIVYKLMPYGEVFRVFSLLKNGQVELDGDPHNKFPLSQPSHLTVFMDDAEICRIKRTWIKGSFIVDVSPTLAMVQEASRRQKVRTGFSDWEYRQSK